MSSTPDRLGGSSGQRLRGDSGFVLARQLRWRVVVGKFCRAQAVTVGLTAPSALIALAYGAWNVAAGFVLMVLASLGVFAMSATVPAFKRWSGEKSIRGSESLLLVILVLIASSAFLVLPFGSFGFEPLDAWFEAVSSVTSTGLTVATRDAIDSEAFFLIRSWGQWYGGILILVGGPALVLRQSALAKRMGEVQARGAAPPVTVPSGGSGYLHWIAAIAAVFRFATCLLRLK